MVEIIDQILTFTNTIWALLLFLGCIAVIGFALLKLMDGKYPKKKFMVFEGSVVRFVDQRLDGYKIVPDDLLSIIFKKNQLGEDIRKFQMLQLIQGLSEEIYLAEMVAKILVPLRHMVAIPPELADELKGKPLIIPEEVVNGALLGQRYRELLKSNEEITKAQEPMILAIVSILPVAVIIGIFLLGIWLSAGSITDMLSKASHNTLDLINAQNTFVTNLANATKG